MVDRFFFNKRNPDARIKELREFLDGYPARVDKESIPLMLRCYNDYLNGRGWPFNGSRLNQPEWVIRYFDIFEAVAELAKLEAYRPNPATLPSREALFGRG